VEFELVAASKVMSVAVLELAEVAMVESILEQGPVLVNR
jgi:hypothetical protein